MGWAAEVLRNRIASATGAVRALIAGFFQVGSGFLELMIGNGAVQLLVESIDPRPNRLEPVGGFVNLAPLVFICIDGEEGCSFPHMLPFYRPRTGGRFPLSQPSLPNFSLSPGRSPG
jgi:hypothetical protein